MTKQEEFSVKVEVSSSAIAKWETDKGMLDITNMKAIAQLLNATLDYLLYDGTKLDLLTMRKSIILTEYTKDKIAVRNKKSIKETSKIVKVTDEYME